MFTFHISTIRAVCVNTEYHSIYTNIQHSKKKTAHTYTLIFATSTNHMISDVLRGVNTVFWYTTNPIEHAYKCESKSIPIHVSTKYRRQCQKFKKWKEKKQRRREFLATVYVFRHSMWYFHNNNEMHNIRFEFTDKKRKQMFEIVFAKAASIGRSIKLMAVDE